MIGIICALKIEVEGIQQTMTDRTDTQYARMTFTKGKISGREVVAVECGIGKVNAAVCAQVMIDLFKPEVIINSGIAGALCDEISIGDIVVAKDVVQHDMDGTAMGDPPGEIWFNDEKKIAIEADKKVREALYNACKDLENTKTLMGRIATGDVFVAAVEKRFAIRDKFNAHACEMEGGAIGQVCYRNGVPFGIIRSISDDINQNEFMDFEKFRQLAGEKSIKAILKFIEIYNGGNAMIEVNFYDKIEDEKLKFAVIISKTQGKWVFCKHKERDTLEVPGGHREPGEDILTTAKRELAEETGAKDFTLTPVCVYSVKGKTRVNKNIDEETFGMLYFADIKSFEKELHSEMEKIIITEKLPESWTYPLIQPKLIEQARQLGFA